MTTQEKLIRRKQSLLELAEYLQNVSQACRSTEFPASISMTFGSLSRSKAILTKIWLKDFPEWSE